MSHESKPAKSAELIWDDQGDHPGYIVRITTMDGKHIDSIPRGNRVEKYLISESTKGRIVSECLNKEGFFIFPIDPEEHYRQYRAVMDMHAQGISVPQISERLELSTRAVWKFITQPYRPPKRKRRKPEDKLVASFTLALTMAQADRARKCAKEMNVSVGEVFRQAFEAFCP